MSINGGPLLFCAIYLLLGIPYCLWNTRSQYYLAWESRQRALGRWWFPPLVFCQGLVMWPAGAIITAAFFLACKMRR